LSMNLAEIFNTILNLYTKSEMQTLNYTVQYFATDFI